MGGFNTSGTYDTDELELGRGIVYLAEINSSGNPKAYRDLGNVTEFNMTVEEETKDHRSSRTGVSEVDKEVTIQRSARGNLTLDSVNFQNLALFFNATEEETVTQDTSLQAEFVLQAAGDWALGTWIDLTKGVGGDRMFDVDATKLTIESDTTALVLNTDYTLDSEFGRIFILPTSTAADPENDDLTVTIAATWSTTASVSQIHGLSKTSSQVALKFIQENPAANAKKKELQVHKTILRANGDHPMIGDEWTTMGFSFTAERDVNRDTAEQFFTFTNVPDA